MKDKEQKLIWESYKDVNVHGESYESMSDQDLHDKLKELQAAMDYYNHVDDHGKWQQETPERDKTSDQIKTITTILKAREYENKSPEERKPPTQKARFIPGGPKSRFMPSEVREIKMKMRDQGIFPKLLGNLDNPRNQTRTAVFYVKFGALPTSAEFGPEWLHQGEGEMSPYPFKASEHPDLEGKVWEYYYVDEIGNEVDR